jgi:hypothetical protein
MEGIKKIILSKQFRLIVSGVLIFIAFRRVDVGDLWRGLSVVPWWFVVLMLIYGFLGVAIGSVRWSYLLLEKPKLKDVWVFVKANYLGAFYSLFLSSSVGGDLVKWLPLIKKYPKLTKTQIASSVVIDRVLGLSGLAIVAFLSVIAGRIIGFDFPDYIFWFFLFLFLVMIGFYLSIYFLDFEKYFGKYGFLGKALKVADLLKKEKKKRIFLGLAISLLGQPYWMGSFWFISFILGAGMSLVSILIFTPVVSLILTLPISVAGFGAREQLFLLLFSQSGLAADKILLVSALGGVMGVINSLLGGLLLLF